MAADAWPLGRASLPADLPLVGMTVSVKDNISVAGLPWTAGHPLFARRTGTEDASIVRRLRQLGASIVGVSPTDAGGFGVTTPSVVNPLAPDLIAGGSSGGTAVAVATRLADLGIGTDTAGSIRIPAACCGLFGFKPSFGRLAMDGVWPLSPRFDHLGFVTRGIDELELTISSVMPNSMSPARAYAVVGFDPTRIRRCESPIAKMFEFVLQRLRSTGVLVREIELPDADGAVAAHGALTIADAQAVYSHLADEGLRQLGEAARRALAHVVEPAARVAAEERCEKARSQTESCFDEVDVILAPTLPIDVPRVGQRRIDLDGRCIPLIAALVAETCLANISGGPSVAIPVPQLARSAIPFSLLLTAACGEDASLLQFARDTSRELRGELR